MDEITNDKFGTWYLLNLEIEEIKKAKKKRDLIEELFAPVEQVLEERKPKELPDFFTYKL